MRIDLPVAATSPISRRQWVRKYVAVIVDSSKHLLSADYRAGKSAFRFAPNTIPANANKLPYSAFGFSFGCGFGNGFLGSFSARFAAWYTNEATIADACIRFPAWTRS